jgi:hypothetical protein
MHSIGDSVIGKLFFVKRERLEAVDGRKDKVLVIDGLRYSMFFVVLLVGVLRVNHVSYA